MGLAKRTLAGGGRQAPHSKMLRSAGTMNLRMRLAPSLTLALACSSGVARAADEAPSGQGISGGALLATELAVLGGTAAGVEPLWAYVLGGAAFAAGGGFAGHLVEENAVPEASAWLLGGGLALLVPTIVWVGNAHGARPAQEPVPKPRQTGLYRSVPAPWAASPPAPRATPATSALRLPIVWGSF